MTRSTPVTGLSERFCTVLDCVRVCIHESPSHLKTIAAAMNLSPSDLSRKLANKPRDPRRFTLVDLEAYVEATGDTTAIQYLTQKYCATTSESNALEALAVLRSAAPQLQALLKQAGVSD